VKVPKAEIGLLRDSRTTPVIFRNGRLVVGVVSPNSKTSHRTASFAGMNQESKPVFVELVPAETELS
jgi:hypothetical protein